MEIKIETQYSVSASQTETYMAFRQAVPKPPNEDAHLRHILRFYMARAMLKRGEQEVYILPDVSLNGTTIRVDVAARTAEKYTLSICEPESVTAETEAILDLLKDVDQIEVFIVHSQYGQPGKVMTVFADQLKSKKFNLLAVVPPPFDDVYEYDIWMFETTFRNLFEGTA